MNKENHYDLGALYLVGGVLALVLFVGIYFSPSIMGRHKRHHTNIFFINLLFGWTIIGWIYAWILVVKKDKVIDEDALKMVTRLREEGLITEEEFIKERKRIVDPYKIEWNKPL